MEEQRHFFDAPAFLDGISSIVLGFCGSILFLVFFVAINKGKLSKGTLVLSSLLLYVFSVLTGAALLDVIGNRPSSFVAAFWAPLVYCSIISILIGVFYKPPKKGKSEYDHLIH